MPLGCFGFTEHVGDICGLAVGPSGALMPSGRAVTLTTLVIVLTIVDH